MKQQAYEQGKAAYQSGDWLRAVTQLGQVKEAGEKNGEVDHLLGNAYMKLGQFESAAYAYNSALEDVAYGKVGALLTNRGRALLAAGQTQNAIDVLSKAVQDPSYLTPYKAYLALGSAYEQLGDTRNAGIAYRNAAVDEANPHPSGALRSLGKSFMGLGRPVDAVEAYRTALDFLTPLESQAEVYCELGLAYVAANRMSEAVDAFSHATSDAAFVMPDDARAAYEAAQNAVARIRSRKPSETDAFLQAAGYGNYDPLDPMGESGELIPSAEDTGFFSLSEEDILAQDKKDSKVRRKHRHTGLKVFLVILVLLAALCGGGVFAYTQGYGWPTQQSVIEGIFSAKAQGTSGNIKQYITGTVDDKKVQEISNTLPSSGTPTISDLTKTATTSTAHVTVNTGSNGNIEYTIALVRDGIGWKVSDVVTNYVPSNGQQQTSNTQTNGQQQTDNNQQTNGQTQTQSQSGTTNTEQTQTTQTGQTQSTQTTQTENNSNSSHSSN